MIQNQQLIFSGMDKDTDESKYQKTTCLENFNVRFINTESNVIGTLQNERDYKVILTCNNLNTDNVTCEKIIGHLKYDSNRLCLFFVNLFGNIVVADLEFNEQTKEFDYVKREDNPHITTIQYAEDEIVQCTFGEDTYANYIFWTSENSGGLQKYLVDAKNVNLLGEPVFPFEGITKVEIRDGGMIPQGMVKYFISTTNDLGVESNKWDTDWYYVKDSDIEKTKQIVLTLNITKEEQNKIRNVIIYRLQHTSGGVTAHCVGNFQPSESIVIDNGTSQIPIDPDLLLQQNHINDNVNCLKVFQDRLFVSTKKDDSDIEAKWEDENINYSLVTKELDSPNDSLSKTTHFYDGNGYVFGLEFLDSNGEVKLRVKSNKFGFDYKQGKFANGVMVEIPNKFKGAYPYARAFVGTSEIQKFVETGIVNPTLVYYDKAVMGTRSFSDCKNFFNSSVFRPIIPKFDVYYQSKIEWITDRYVSKNSLGGKSDAYETIDYGCGYIDDVNLDKDYICGNLSNIDLINSSFVEFRNGYPLFATGSRGCEFAFSNVLNGWYGTHYYKIENGRENDGDLKKLETIELKFYPPNEQGIIETRKLLYKTHTELKEGSGNVCVNYNLVNLVLPIAKDPLFNISSEYKITNILEFKESTCYTFADLDLTQGETTDNSPTKKTASTFGLNGLVFKTSEEKYAHRIGVCLPRVTINPNWNIESIDGSVTLAKEPDGDNEYNVIYTPLYAPLKVGDIDIKQKTINIRKCNQIKAKYAYGAPELKLVKIEQLDEVTPLVKIDSLKFIGEVSTNVIKTDFTFENDITKSFAGLLNNNDFDLLFSECGSPLIDYAWKPESMSVEHQGTIDIYLKQGQILSRLCAGVKFNNNFRVSENFWCAMALSEKDLKHNLIGYSFTAREDGKNHIQSGLFDWLNLTKNTNFNKSCYFPDYKSYLTKSDTPIKYKSTNGILCKFKDNFIIEVDTYGTDGGNFFYNEYSEKPYLFTANVTSIADPQRQDKIMYQASTIQSTANGFIYATIGDVYKGEQRYIATIPDASCPNQVLDIIDAEVYTTTDPNCYYKMEDESLLLHTDDYNKAFRRNPNLDSEGARKMIYEFTGIIDNKTLDYVDYRLYWSLPKSAPLVEGTSAFDKIFSNSSIDLDQTAGAITKIESFGDKLFVFQETKVSVISYNERGIVQLEGTNPISIMNEQSVQGFTPMTDHFGLQKHYQCCKTDKGIYWLDSINKELFMIDESCQVDKTGISIQTNMYSWFIKNASKNFVLYYNYFYKDLMMSLHGRNNHEKLLLEHSIDNDTFADSIAFSEFVGGFSSFYDLYRNNIGSNIFGDSEYMVNANGIYEWSKGQYTRPFYTCFVASENSFMDKVFYNLDYHADCYIRQGISDFYAEPYEIINQSEKLPKNEELYHPAFTHFRCWNNYQDTGIVDLTFRKHGSSNLKRLFRTWRIQIPRDKKVRRDRIRNQWAKILLGNHKINEDRRYSLHDFVLTFDTK